METPIWMWRRTLIHTYLAHQLTEWKIVNISWNHACKWISAVEDSTAANVKENQRSQGRTLQIVSAQKKKKEEEEEHYDKN